MGDIEGGPVAALDYSLDLFLRPIKVFFIPQQN